MRSAAFLSLALVLGVSPGPSHAADETEPAAILAKAIKAMGGEERMTRFKACTWKAKGKLYGPGGAEIATTEGGAVQLPSKHRLELAQVGRDRSISQLIVIDGDRGWATVPGRTFDLPKETLAAQREEYFSRFLVVMPTLLKDKMFTLSPLGEVKVGDRPAVGIRVSREGRPDLNIFFDKESGLPVKTETRVKERDQDVVHEFFYSNYKEFDGLRRFTRMTWDKDGQRFGEKEWSEVKFQEKLDDGVFAKP